MRADLAGVAERARKGAGSPAYPPSIVEADLAALVAEVRALRALQAVAEELVSMLRGHAHAHEVAAAIGPAGASSVSVNVACALLCGSFADDLSDALAFVP